MISRQDFAQIVELKQQFDATVSECEALEIELAKGKSDLEKRTNEMLDSLARFVVCPVVVISRLRAFPCSTREQQARTHAELIRETNAHSESKKHLAEKLSGAFA